MRNAVLTIACLSLVLAISACQRRQDYPPGYWAELSKVAGQTVNGK